MYEAIEKKIKVSGYPRAISGADAKVMIFVTRLKVKKQNIYYQNLTKTRSFEYHITIQDENFNWVFSIY